MKTNILRLSEGSESAARIMKRLESECGFGACSGHPDCRDRHCPEHPCKTGMLGLPVLDTMTDDRFNLHRVDASQLVGKKDSMSFGGLEHIPSDAAEHIGSVARQGHALKTFFIVGIALALGLIVWASLP